MFAPLAWQLADGSRRWGCATDAVSCFRESLQEARAAGRHVFVSAEALSYLEQNRCAASAIVECDAGMGYADL